MITLLKGAQVLDPSHGSSDHHDVLIAGEQVHEVGQPESFDDVADVVIDMQGLWLTPSLVDMHAHLTLNSRAHLAGLSWDADASTTAVVAYATKNLVEAARCGIALIRDLGARESAITDVEKLPDDLVVPEVFWSGEPLTCVNGHGSRIGRSFADGPDGVADAVAWIEAQPSSQRPWLKIMNDPERWPQHALETFVEAAHRVGRRVAIHAYTDGGVADAISAGADTVEHAYRAPVAATTKSTTFTPTLHCSAVSLCPYYTADLSPPELSALTDWRQLLMAIEVDGRSAGEDLLIGTDAGCAPCTPADIIHEMVALESVGFSRAAVLRAATRTAAEVLGRYPAYGCIAPGGLANLIVTSESPLRHLAALASPTAVWLRGKEVLHSSIALSLGVR